MTSNTVVLAFSGGLDTSFCVPWLRERGHEVVTVFVDTGGQTFAEVAAIEQRARDLGAAGHVTADAADALWSDIVVPLIMSGEWYRGQYPLLCSDRYLVVARGLAECRRLGTRRFAHGCTGVGNDQVRFDLAVRSLGDYEILAPVRDIQNDVDNLREYEQAYLAERGFGVATQASRYTRNRNLLGVTISGSEIDRWGEPEEDTCEMTAPPEQWPAATQRFSVTFREGVAVALDGETLPGAQLLNGLNERAGAHGIGRGIYTGDTCVGLKGRIVFEAPGIEALHIAHRALEQATCTRWQNDFKPTVARKWTEMVYHGFYFDPLRSDLEAYLRASQKSVNGTVTLAARQGRIDAVSIDSPNILARPDAVYAQKADWSDVEAQGFIKLAGQSSELWARINRSGDDGAE